MIHNLQDHINCMDIKHGQSIKGLESQVERVTKALIDKEEACSRYEKNLKSLEYDLESAYTRLKMYERLENRSKSLDHIL